MQTPAPHELPSFVFTAPERIMGSSFAVADDIFSMGALLYFMVTGTPPFPVAEGECAQAWASRVCQLELNIPQYGMQLAACALDTLMRWFDFLLELPVPCTKRAALAHSSPYESWLIA
jgi:serine/threonine protein kinase